MNDKFIVGLGLRLRIDSMDEPFAPTSVSRQMHDTALRTPKLLSIVAPVYDEEELVEQFVERACAAAADYEFELVLVNDGSSDATPELLDGIAAADRSRARRFISRGTSATRRR